MLKILDIIAKGAKARDVVITILPSTFIYLLDAWQNIIPWLVEEQAGGAAAFTGYAISKLYDLIMGERTKRNNELNRAKSFILLIKKIRESEKITSDLKLKIITLIDQVELKIEMLESKVISVENFNKQLDELIETFEKSYDKSITSSNTSRIISPKE